MEGTPFGRYQLLSLLGRGGMGEVWRAFDSATNRVVAVKVLTANLANDPHFEKRFRREALAAASLANPHVVPIHFFGEIDGRLYVDMQLVEGRDLQSVLAEGPLEPARAVAIISQVATALNAAHRINLIHRDVKPSNILLGEDDFAYLIDFGIARAVGEAGLTGTGNIVGTWAYMAPERIQDNQVDAKVDIYALACVLHECLTGRPPFPGKAESQIKAHLTQFPPCPSKLCDSVPAAMDTVIAKGMAKNPAERYSTTKELAAAAREALDAPLAKTVPAAPKPEQGRGTPTPPPKPPSQPPPKPPPMAYPSTPPPRGAGVVSSGPIAAPNAPRWQPPPPAQPIGPPPGAPPAANTPAKAWWRRKAVVIPAAIAVALALLSVIAVAAVQYRQNSTPQRAEPTTSVSSYESPPTTGTTETATDTTEAATGRSCNVLRTSSENAVSSANAYVDADDARAPDTESKKQAAITALTNSYGQVSNSMSDALDTELDSALTAYLDATRTLTNAMKNNASNKEFNAAIDAFNAAKVDAVDKCQARGH